MTYKTGPLKNHNSEQMRRNFLPILSTCWQSNVLLWLGYTYLGPIYTTEKENFSSYTQSCLLWVNLVNNILCICVAEYWIKIYWLIVIVGCMLRTPSHPVRVLIVVLDCLECWLIHNIWTDTTNTKPHTANHANIVLKKGLYSGGQQDL